MPPMYYMSPLFYLFICKLLPQSCTLNTTCSHSNLINYQYFSPHTHYICIYMLYYRVCFICNNDFTFLSSTCYVNERARIVNFLYLFFFLLIEQSCHFFLDEVGTINFNLQVVRDEETKMRLKSITFFLFVSIIINDEYVVTTYNSIIYIICLITNA